MSSFGVLMPLLDFFWKQCRKTRKREFLDEMERVVPWAVLVQIVEPYYPKAKTGRPPIGIQTMLRIHDLQQ